MTEVVREILHGDREKLLAQYVGLEIEVLDAPIAVSPFDRVVIGSTQALAEGKIPFSIGDANFAGLVNEREVYLAVKARGGFLSSEELARAEIEACRQLKWMSFVIRKQSIYPRIEYVQYPES